MERGAGGWDFGISPEGKMIMKMNKTIIFISILQICLIGCATNKVKCSCSSQDNNYIPYGIYGESYNLLGDKVYPEIKLWKVKAINIADGEIKLGDNMSGNFARTENLCMLNLALEEKGKKQNILFQRVVCLQDYPISEGDIIELYNMNYNLAWRLKIEKYNQKDRLGRQITFNIVKDKKTRKGDVMK